MNRNELTVVLHLKRGTSTNSAAPKPKPPVGFIRVTERSIHQSQVEAFLEFTNISAKNLRIENRLWFIRLKVLADGKLVNYIGPMVSLGPPTESDFVTLKPGDKFTTESVVLNSYYGLTDDFKGALEVSFQFSGEVPLAVATLPSVEG